MTRIAFIFRELFRNLWRHPITALSSFLSLALILLLFDLFWVASGTSQAFYRNLLSDLQMEVFVSEETADSLMVPLQTQITSVSGVKTVQFISRDSARARLEAMVGGDLLAGYEDSNPLPRSFVLTFWPDHLNLSDMDAIDKEISSFIDVDRIFYSRSWLEKAESARELIWTGGTALGILTLLTALITIANSFRLLASSRASGFRQMQLQGAGSLFVAMPLLIEAFLLGGVAAAVGWLVIKYGHDKIDFSRFAIILPPNDQVVYFCIGIAALAVTSGFLGLRRQLRWRRR